MYYVQEEWFVLNLLCVTAHRIFLTISSLFLDYKNGTLLIMKFINSLCTELLVEVLHNGRVPLTK